MSEEAPQVQQKGLPPAVQHLLRSMAGDMKFMGIVTIIGGALTCLSIIGAAIGIPYIFAGIRLKDSAATFEAYANRADAGSLRTALELQGKYFRIMKILTLVGIGIVVLYIVFLVLMLAMAFSG